MKIDNELPNKIKNLNAIKSIANIPKYYYFDFKSFEKNKKEILKNIQKNFEVFIVRSATYNEDNRISNAGKYLSIPKIKTKNSQKIELSIKKVFDSYKNNNWSTSGNSNPYTGKSGTRTYGGTCTSLLNC